MKKLIVILAFFVSLFSTAQKESYYGFEFGVIRSKLHFFNNIEQIHSLNLVDGFSTGISYRRKLKRNLLINTGYSFRIYSPAYLYEDYYIESGISYVFHNVPITMNYEKSLFKNKIIGFISIGSAFSFDSYKEGGNIIIKESQAGPAVSLTWENLTNSRINIFPMAGFGSRLNLIESLCIELAINYYFTISDLRRYSCSIISENGEVNTFNFYDGGDYFNFSLGIFYSLQKTKSFLKNKIEDLTY